MSLHLERGDLLQLEPISSRGTLKLLPLGKKNKQKLLIGDDSGTISCYEFKKGEPQVVFQNKVFEGAVTCLTLGGPSIKRDKIFASHSQRIVGLTKKGKDFFKLTSSLTETIQRIAVEDTRIWTGCEYIYNLYDDGKDTAYFISKDKINDLIVANVTRDHDFDTVLGCQDSCIRIVHGSKLFLEIPTQNPVTSVAFMDVTSDVTVVKGPTALFFGMNAGELGMVQVFSSGEFTHIWTVDDAELRSPINCICVCDLNKNKVKDVVIGRDDGRVEVFKLQQETIFAVPTKVFSKNIGESVRSIECGIVSTVGFQEIIVASYSGKIISFTTEPVQLRSQDDNYGRSVQAVNNENRIKHMQKELDDLRKKIDKERGKLEKNNLASQITTKQIATMIVAQDFHVNSRFHLDASLAAYVLTIELQIPIDLIMIRSPVALDLVEQETGTSVLSVTPPQMQIMAANATNGVYDGEVKNKSSEEDTSTNFVAVFRCQRQEKRIVLTLRTNEGEFGEMVVTIVAQMAQNKAAKIIRHDLKPLSLNTKTHELKEEEASRPRNKIKYSGNVNMATLHEWVQSIFPDVPPHLDEKAIDQKYFFRNTFTGAISICEFRKNEIVVESESASTIAIAKENIIRFANYRRMLLEESVSANDDSVASFLTLIRPKLDHQLSLARKMNIVDALQEITMQQTQEEVGNNWLSEDYREILRDQETIRKEFKNRDKSLEYLSGIITDLFVDWNRLQGLDRKKQIPNLQQVMMSGDFNQLVETFLNSGKN